MKHIVILVTILFTTAVAQQDVGINMENYKELFTLALKDMAPDIFEQLHVYAKNEYVRGGGYTEVVVNDYVDKILANIKKLLAESSVNNVSIPTVSLKIESSGTLNLTKGVLSDITSASRDGDVVLDYSSDTNTITLTLPLSFDDIKYRFDYAVKVLLISAHGGLHGTIKNVKIDIVLSFDFNTYHVSLSHYDMKNTGQITISFTGNKLVDWLIDAISAVVTAALHPLVVNILQSNIANLIKSVIGGINDAIDSVLHPTTAEVLTTAAANLF